MTGPASQPCTRDASTLAAEIEAPLRELVNRAHVAERNFGAACAELRHVLDGLPYAKAQSGKYRKLRRRLERFLSDRLDGL